MRGTAATPARSPAVGRLIDWPPSRELETESLATHDASPAAHRPVDGCGANTITLGGSIFGSAVKASLSRCGSTLLGSWSLKLPSTTRSVCLIGWVARSLL